MRSEDRQKYILSVAQNLGFVSIREAAEYTKTSIETVRRDINKLSLEGKLEKVRGGAEPTKLALRRDADYLQRVHHNKSERRSIGREAAAMVKSGDVVALDCGVSIQSVAENLHGLNSLTVVTNSLPTATILLHKINAGELRGRVIMIGGEFNVENRFTKGPMVTEEVDKYYFDISFISCTSLSEDGVSSYTLDECGLSRHLIARSARSVLVAESEKIGKNSLYEFAKLCDFDKIITDDANKLPQKLEKYLTEHNTEICVVKTR